MLSSIKGLKLWSGHLRLLTSTTLQKREIPTKEALSYFPHAPLPLCNIVWCVWRSTAALFQEMLLQSVFPPGWITLEKEYLFLYLRSITLLSSITVLRDSIHIGSISPSSTIHLGPSWEMLASSRMIDENSPGRVTNMLMNIEVVTSSNKFFQQLPKNYAFSLNIHNSLHLDINNIIWWYLLWRNKILSELLLLRMTAGLHELHSHWKP